METKTIEFPMRYGKTNVQLQAIYANTNFKDIVDIVKAFDLDLVKEIIDYGDNIFPINELKKRLEDMTTIEKLKKLRDNNPNFADAIENEFPEIVDNEPFIMVNSLFMRRDYTSNMYHLNYSDGFFYVTNLRDDKRWQTKVHPSNPDANNFKDYYLTKNDFKALLKASGIKLDTIRLVDYDILKHMHNVVYS